jgi:tetratricopeptide (TPR) repeat protein
MRILAFIFAISLGLVTPALAQSERETTATPPPAAAEPPTEEPTREVRLDRLFDTLKLGADAEAGRAAEQEIIALWLESGSDTVDLLMGRTLTAMEAKDYPLALDYLDRILILKPDYAEGWNKRATVHFLVDDYSKAIADIERTLSIEPRHFGALSGLGTIMRDLGDKDRALTAYRQALDIDPYLDSVKDALTEIEKETAGQDI